MLAIEEVERREIEQAALAVSERIARRDGPYAAQLAGAATWHAITVGPNCDRSAAAHLVGRRFGVYLPETCGDRPNKRDPLLPGYLFLFVWGIEQHAKRILGCPGVVDFLRVNGDIALIPDAIVDQVREIENRALPISLPNADAMMRQDRRKKRWRKTRSGERAEAAESQIIGSRPYSAILDAMDGLDAAERIRTFQAALSQCLGLQASRLANGG